MKNFDNEIKKSIEEIKPDPYMETRLSKKISDYKKPKISPSLKKIGVAALALAIVCTGIGANYAVKNNRSDLDFIIVAYAGDGSQTLNKRDIKMKDIARVKKEYSNADGIPVLTTTYVSFEIRGNNISEVTFKSDNYPLFIYDTDMHENHWERYDYYIIDIPLTEEEINKFDENYKFDFDEKYEKEFIKNMMKKRDLSAYFGNNSMDINNYHIASNLDNPLEYLGDKVSHLYLVKNEVYEEVSREGCEITEKNYDENDKIRDIQMDTFTASEYIMKYPDAELSELPKNTITITIKFKGGQTATATVHTSFDDYGYLHCSLEQ